MPLTYVLDEHLRRSVWMAIQRHNASGPFVIDVIRVGDPVDLQLGSIDPDLLRWAEKENRVVVTRDYNTMRSHLAAHLQAGHHCAGLFIIRPQAAFRRSLIILSSPPTRLIPRSSETTMNTSPNLG